MQFTRTFTIACLVLALASTSSDALSTSSKNNYHQKAFEVSRRNALFGIGSAAALITGSSSPAMAVDSVEDYLRTGMVSMPMGVSGQAGKSKPETGIILRDGSEVSRDSRTGDVLAEILLSSAEDKDSKMPVFASFQSPWPLATGAVFDVECRNADSGDSVFLAVSPNTKGKALADLPDSFFVNTLIAPTGRFSFYGQPTDVKVKKSPETVALGANYRVIDMSFSTLSQSTQTEIPRRARIVATIPDGAAQAVMLVGAASSQRWKKGAQEQISKVSESFRAAPAPTNMAVRAKTKNEATL